MTITRPGQPEEVLNADHRRQRRILDRRRPAGDGDDAYVKVNYALQGEPHEVELPFVPATPPTTP